MFYCFGCGFLLCCVGLGCLYVFILPVIGGLVVVAVFGVDIRRILLFLWFWVLVVLYIYVLGDDCGFECWCCVFVRFVCLFRICMLVG